MTQSDRTVFLYLFQKVHFKCFGTDFIRVLTESEAKLLSNEIFESTGLVLGWKSFKNYTQYLLNNNQEIATNPSVPSLDTLVRYIENAPKTDEINRKKYESHYPFWFGFKEKTLVEIQKGDDNESVSGKKIHTVSGLKLWLKIVLVLSLCGSILYIFYYSTKKETPDFTENFENLSSLKEKGWMIKNPDFDYWNKQNSETRKHSLYTLRGDNFEESDSVNGIKNMLLRKISANSFSAELHISNFVPSKNWQQVGIILMEDTIAKSKALRFSIGYNDFFGGYNKPGEIILQVLSSTAGNFLKPEEIIQTPIFQKNPEQENLIQRNLEKSALRIEKSNNDFRFLYATGEKDIFAFKEIKSKELNISPKYIGIYASSGNNPEATIISVQLDKFIIKGK